MNGLNYIYVCGLSLGEKSEEKFQGQILDISAFGNRIMEKKTERGQPGRQKSTSVLNLESKGRERLGGGKWSAVSSAAERSTWARDRAIGLVTLEFNGHYHWRIWLDLWCKSRDFDLIRMG